jgi:hypothetical protein
MAVTSGLVLVSPTGVKTFVTRKRFNRYQSLDSIVRGAVVWVG